MLLPIYTNSSTLDPVKFRLISLEAALTVLKLSTAIYPPGSWLSASDKVPEETSAEIEESWSLRSGLSNWAWRTITELKDVKDESNAFLLHFIGEMILNFSQLSKF